MFSAAKGTIPRGRRRNCNLYWDEECESLYKQWRTQDFSMGGGSVTSHRDDVKILHYNYSSLDVLKCIVL